MGGHLVDVFVWVSRRLRYAVLAILAIAAVKTAVAVLDQPHDPTPAGAEIAAWADVVSE